MSNLFAPRPIDIVRTTVNNIKDVSLINWHGRIYTLLSQCPYGATVLGDHGYEFLGANAQVRVNAVNLRVQS